MSIADFLFRSTPYVESGKKYRGASHICVTSGRLTVLTKLGNGELIIPKLKKTPTDIISARVLNDKIRAAKDAKKVLMNKLQSAEKSISSLAEQLEFQTMPKKKKLWHKELEDLRAAENEADTRRLMKEQAERNKQQISRRKRELVEATELEEKNKRLETEEAERKREKEKLEKYAEARVKAEERKKYIEGIKELKAKKRQWLYEKLEDQYEKTVVVSENKRIAQVLAQKQVAAVPTAEELQIHIKHHKKLMESRSVYRPFEHLDSKRFTPSKFFTVLQEEEDLMKEMEKIKECERLDRIERKNNYAKLVKQLYLPSTSVKSVHRPIKADKRYVPSKARVMSVSPPLRTGRESSNENSVPKVRKKEVPKINYLQQRREIRELAAESLLENKYWSMDINSLEVAKKIEGLSKQAEVMIKNKKTHNLSVDGEEKLSKALLDSVKFKLEALTNMKN